MSRNLHALDQRRLIDSNGIADGASIYFYLAGTLTPATVYTAATGASAHTHPIVVAAGAAVPDIYLDPEVTYRRRIVYTDGSVDDIDPYTTPFVGTAALGASGGSALVGHIASGSGAVARTVQDKLREMAVSPEDFGADETGVADSTASIQAAINQVHAAGGGVVRLGAGLYSCTSFTIKEGVTLAGVGAYETKIVKRGTATAHLVSYAAEANNIALEDLTIDGGSGAEDFSLVSMGDSRNNMAFRRVRFLNGMNKPALRSDWTVAVENIELDTCVFENCPMGGHALNFASGTKPTGHRNISIHDCLFDGVGASISLLFADYAGGAFGTFSSYTPDTFIGVSFCNNRIINCSNTGDFGPIPVEHWGCTDYTATGNQILSGTRGMSAGQNMKNGLIADNIIANQTKYAAESGACENVSFVRNKVRDCKDGVKFTVGGIIRNFDGSYNTFDGTGLSAYDTAEPPATFQTNPIYAADMLMYNCTFRGNVISKPEWLKACFDLRFSQTDAECRVEVTDNVIYLNTVNSTAVGITMRGYRKIAVRNRIYRTAAIDGTHYQNIAGTALGTLINYQNDAAGCTFDIIDNHLEWTGSIPAADHIMAIGLFGSTAAYPGLRIRRNRILGNYGNSLGAVRVNATAGDTAIRDNETSGVTTSPVYSLNAAVVNRENARGSKTYDPGSLAASGGTATTTVTVTGALLADVANLIVIPQFSIDLQGVQLTAYLNADGQATVRFTNPTAGAIDLGSGTLLVEVRRV